VLIIEIYGDIMSVLEILKKEKAVDILLELMITECLTVSEILKKVGGSASTIARRLEELLDAGIIDDEITKDWPYKRVIRLTDKGKSLARFISTFKVQDINALRKLPAKWILLLTYINNGVFESMTRLMKFIFLLEKEFGITTNYEFIWYKYGPFSKDVLNDVDALEQSGLLELDEELLGYHEASGEPIVRKKIILTKKGKQIARDLLFNTAQGIVDKLKSIIKKYYGEPLKKLLDHIYSKYKGDINGG